MAKQAKISKEKSNALALEQVKVDAVTGKIVKVEKADASDSDSNQAEDTESADE